MSLPIRLLLIESVCGLGNGNTLRGEPGGSAWQQCWATDVLHEAPVPCRAIGFGIRSDRAPNWRALGSELEGYRGQ